MEKAGVPQRDEIGGWRELEISRNKIAEGRNQEEGSGGCMERVGGQQGE